VVVVVLPGAVSGPLRLLLRQHRADAPADAGIVAAARGAGIGGAARALRVAVQPIHGLLIETAGHLQAVALLELLERLPGLRPVDAVDLAPIEALLLERLLGVHDAVARARVGLARALIVRALLVLPGARRAEPRADGQRHRGRRDEQNSPHKSSIRSHPRRTPGRTGPRAFGFRD